MHLSILLPTTTCLSLCITLVLSTSMSSIWHIRTPSSSAQLGGRGSSSTTDNSDTTCLTYATVANLSTIGLNSTFRAAFLQASPDGTDKSVGILNTAEKQIKGMVGDEELNTRCGNATATAAVEAPLNFSMGVVGPFTIAAANAAVKTATAVLGHSVWILLIVSGVLCL